MENEVISCLVCVRPFKKVVAYKKHWYSPAHEKKMGEIFQRDAFDGHGQFPYIIVLKQQLMNDTNKPIIGLSLLTACFSQRSPSMFYLCHVCEEKVPQKQIFFHLYSATHYANYYNFTDPDRLSFAWIPSMDMRITLIPEAMKEVQDRGSGQLQMLDLPPNLFSALFQKTYSEVMRTLCENDKLLVLLQGVKKNRTNIQTYQRDCNRKHPLLGMQHLVECICVEKTEKRHYLCTLCCQTVAPHMIIKHVISLDHIHSYFKAWHPGTLMSKECYKKYNSFASTILDFAKQTEEIHQTANTDMKQVSVEPALFTSLSSSCYAEGLNKLESIRRENNESSLMMNVTPGVRLEFRVGKPSCRLRCQDCNLIFETVSQYVTHVLKWEHQQMLREIFGPETVGDDYDQRARIPMLSLYKHITQNLEPIIGVPLIVVCISSQAPVAPIYMCFACEDNFPDTLIKQHLTSRKHLIHTLLYQNPWQLPFAWENQLDMPVLKSLAWEERRNKGPNEMMMKVFDIPHWLYPSHIPHHQYVLETLQHYQHHLKREVPKRETFGNSRQKQNFPLLGQEFIVQHNVGEHQSSSRGWAFLCLLCERRLSVKENFAHVFSREHVAKFLERIHPGSLDSCTENTETLLDLAKQAALIHPVSSIQKIRLPTPIWEPCSYHKAIICLSAVKRNEGNGQLVPPIIPQMKLVPTETVKEVDKDNATGDGQKKTVMTEGTGKENNRESTDSSETALQNLSLEAETDSDKHSLNKMSGGVSDSSACNTVSETEMDERSECAEIITEHRVESGENAEKEGDKETLAQNEKESQRRKEVISETVPETPGDEKDQVVKDEKTEIPESLAGTKQSFEASERFQRAEAGKESNKSSSCLLTQECFWWQEDKTQQPSCSASENSHNSRPSEDASREMDNKRQLVNEGPRAATATTKGLNTIFKCTCDQHEPIYLCECHMMKIPELSIIRHIIGFHHQMVSLVVLVLDQDMYKYISEENFNSAMEMVKELQVQRDGACGPPPKSVHPVSTSAPPHAQHEFDLEMEDSQVMDMEIDLPEPSSETAAASVMTSDDSIHKFTVPTCNYPAAMSSPTTLTKTTTVLKSKEVTSECATTSSNFVVATAKVQATPSYTAATSTKSTATPSNTAATSTKSTATPSNTAATSTKSTATPSYTAATSTKSTATPSNTAATITKSTATPSYTAATSTKSTATPSYTVATSTKSTATPSYTAATSTKSTATPSYTAATSTKSTATPSNTVATSTKSTATPSYTAATSTKSTATPSNIAATSTKSTATPSYTAATSTKSTATPSNTAATSTKSIATPSNTAATSTKSTATPSNTAATSTKSTATPSNTAATSTKSTATPSYTAATSTKSTATPSYTAATSTKSIATPSNTAATSTKSISIPSNTAATRNKSIATPSNTAPASPKSIATPSNTAATSTKSTATPSYTAATSTKSTATPSNIAATSTKSTATPSYTAAASTKSTATPSNTAPASPKSTATPSNTAATSTKSIATPSNTAATRNKSITTPSNTAAASTKSIATPSNTAATSTKSIATPSNTAATRNKSITTPSNTAAASPKSIATPSNTAATSTKSIATPSNTAATSTKSIATPSNTAATRNKSIATPSNTAATPSKSTVTTNSCTPNTSMLVATSSKLTPAASLCTATMSNTSASKSANLKVGLNQLITLKYEGKQRVYCQLCSVSLTDSNHVIDFSHQYNYVRHKYPLWTPTDEELKSKVPKVVTRIAEMERKAGFRSQIVEVSLDDYEQIKALSVKEALCRIKSLMRDQRELQISSSSTAKPEPKRMRLQPSSATAFTQKSAVAELSPSCMSERSRSELRKVPVQIPTERDKINPKPITSPSVQKPDITEKKRPECPHSVATGLESTDALASSPYVRPETAENPQQPERSAPESRKLLVGTRRTSLCPPASANAEEQRPRGPGQEEHTLKVSEHSQGPSQPKVPKVPPLVAVGLGSVWECRGKSLLPFFLCESCGERLSLAEICQHVASTEHQLSYMFKHYRHFLYFWSEQDLPKELKLALSKEIAKMLSDRERSRGVDTQVVHLSQELYERVWKAPFDEALNTVQNINREQTGSILCQPVSSPQQKGATHEAKHHSGEAAEAAVLGDMEEDQLGRVMGPAHVNDVPPNAFSAISPYAAACTRSIHQLAHANPLIWPADTNLLSQAQNCSSETQPSSPVKQPEPLGCPTSSNFCAQPSQTASASSRDEPLPTRPTPAVASVESLVGLCTHNPQPEDPLPAKCTRSSPQPMCGGSPKSAFPLSASTSVNPVLTPTPRSPEDEDGGQFSDKQMPSVEDKTLFEGLIALVRETKSNKATSTHCNSRLEHFPTTLSTVGERVQKGLELKNAMAEPKMTKTQRKWDSNSVLIMSKTNSKTSPINPSQRMISQTDPNPGLSANSAPESCSTTGYAAVGVSGDTAVGTMSPPVGTVDTIELRPQESVAARGICGNVSQSNSGPILRDATHQSPYRTQQSPGDNATGFYQLPIAPIITVRQDPTNQQQMPEYEEVNHAGINRVVQDAHSFPTFPTQNNIDPLSVSRGDGQFGHVPFTTSHYYTEVFTGCTVTSNPPAHAWHSKQHEEYAGRLHGNQFYPPQQSHVLPCVESSTTPLPPDRVRPQQYCSWTNTLPPGGVQGTHGGACLNFAPCSTSANHNCPQGLMDDGSIHMQNNTFVQTQNGPRWCVNPPITWFPSSNNEMTSNASANPFLSSGSNVFTPAAPASTGNNTRQHFF